MSQPPALKRAAEWKEISVDSDPLYQPSAEGRAAFERGDRLFGELGQTFSNEVMALISQATRTDPAWQAPVRWLAQAAFCMDSASYLSRLLERYWRARAPLYDPRRVAIAGFAPKFVPGKLISIHHFGTSGSYLLSSLFDGHPDILAIPAGARNLTMLLSVACRDKAYSDAIIGILEILPFSRVASLYEITEYNETYKNIHVDHHLLITTFAKMFKKLSPSSFENSQEEKNKSIKLAFFCFNAAYMAARGLPLPSQPHAIVHQAHGWTIEKAKFASLFRDATTIFTVREPFKAFGSQVLNGRIHHGGAGPAEAFWGAISAQHFLVGGSRIAGTKNTLCVRFEDMKLRPEALTRGLCEAVGLPWHPCMLESTFNGLPYVYSGSSGQVTGFTTTNLAKDYSSMLSGFDKLRIDIIFQAHSRKWGYPITRFRQGRLAVQLNRALLWLPFRAEWQGLRERLADWRNPARLWQHLRDYAASYRRAHKMLIKSNNRNLLPGFEASIADCIDCCDAPAQAAQQQDVERVKGIEPSS